MTTTATPGLDERLRRLKPVDLYGTGAMNYLVPPYLHDEIVAALTAPAGGEVRALREALEPFAKLADEIDALNHEEHSTCLHRIAATDLRRAKTVLASLPPAEAAQAGEADWRAMISAPKDGEPVLLEYRANDDGKLYYCVSRWTDSHWRGYPATNFTRWSRPFPTSPSPSPEEEPTAEQEWTGKEIPLQCPFPEQGKIGAPIAYDVDPGAGSACNRLQRDWPSAEQIKNLHYRGGSITPLAALKAAGPSAQQRVSEAAIGEWREVETAHLLKGRRTSPAYFPATGEICEVSGPNCDDANGYTWGETTVLWQNELFVLYGSKGYWPTLHKHEHVLFRPALSPENGGA